MKVTEWLKLPEAEKIYDLDKLATTLLHAKIIKKKPFLRGLYLDYYNQFRKSLPDGMENGLLVELGSGGGFIKDIIPNVVTSDVIKIPDVDEHFSVLDMPFENNTVDAFFMIGVLHHINDARGFFKEVTRCLNTGGKLIMIEPANTLLGQFIYKRFHHEPFDPSGDWSLNKCGRLSSANIAIPWIVFYRDRGMFKKEFPLLKIVRLKTHTTFRYLASGGLSMRQLLPSFTYYLVKGIEILFSPFNRFLGMFMTIEVEKV